MATSDLGGRVGAPTSGDGRWHQVWQLVLEAEQQPAAERRSFLLAAQADPFVVRQALAIVEGSVSLLSYTSVSPSLPSPQDQGCAPQAGMKIGKYCVGALLGSGATGSVYAGLDEELNRAVAIKFFASKPDPKPGVTALPMREARAASALNHPNIIMIHEVIETEETAAIVMELVPGVTLRALGGKRPLLSDVLHWSGQLANALAVAHAHNLIHGDIKPENIMVRDDGYVKLLDFGLAWGTLSDKPAAACLAGTPRYLSPEQCLGQSPTPASDIFSCGVILYELTTGRHPFQVDGMLGLLQAIASADPPEPISFNTKLPRALNRLILEMIAKRPEERPAAEEAAKRLTAIRSHLTAGRPLIPVKAGLSALAAAAVVATLLLLPRQPRGRVDLLKMNIRPMAPEPGLASNPSISPDGLWISCLYRAHTRDRPQFEVRPTQGGPANVLDTRGLKIEEPAAWSPDSRELAFVGLDQSGRRRIYRTSRTGGRVSLLTECSSRLPGFCGVDWSPDGYSLVISEVSQDQTSSDLFTVDLATGQHRPSIPPQSSWVSNPHFSPNGKWIAFDRQTSFTTAEICVVAAAGGAVRCVTHGPWFLSRFGWSRDGRSLIAIAARQAEKPEIWYFPFAGRSDPYRIASFDLGQAQEITVARRKGTLVWVRNLSASSFWRMPVNDPDRPAELLASYQGIEADAEWSSEKRMVFRSDRSGWSEIWIAGADGSDQRQATRFRGPFVGDPHWSPDGRRLAFTAYPNGNADIFTMACEAEGPEPCGNPKQLTRSPATDANPTWSSDGRWIYFSSNRSGRFEVWRIAAAGGEPVRITWNRGYLARESADGKWLYYSKVEKGNGFWRIALPAGGAKQHEEVLIPDTPFRAAGTWALGQRELYYYPSEETSAAPFPSVRAFDLETHRVRDLPVGNTLLGRGLSLSPDGRWLLRTQSDRLLSVIMIAE